MLVSKQQLQIINDEDLGRIATADAGTYSDEAVLAAWEELASRDVVVEFVEQQSVPAKTPSEDLVTVATFRNYVQAQFAQCRLLASGMLAFLFDDNTIRMDWFWSTARRRQTARACRGYSGGVGDSKARYDGPHGTLVTPSPRPPKGVDSLSFRAAC